MAIRISKNWQAKIESNTLTEREYIRKTARQKIDEFARITDFNEQSNYLIQMNKWLQVAVHYRIPYERPYHIPIGVVRKSRL